MNCGICGAQMMDVGDDHSCSETVQVLRDTLADLRALARRWHLSGATIGGEGGRVMAACGDDMLRVLDGEDG